MAIVTWDGGAGTFNWNDAANWDTDALPGATDDAIIPDLAGTPTITYPSGNRTIASLTSSESFALSGGTLVVNGTLSFQGTITLSGGATLRNAQVGGDSGALLEVTSTDGTLDGVTLGVNTTLRAGAQVTVYNGLSLANGSVLRLERTTTNGASVYDVGLNFAGGDQELGGTGSVELFSAFPGLPYSYRDVAESDARVRPTAGGVLTIGPGVTVRNDGDSYLTTLGDASGGALIIRGTVSAQSAGQPLRLTGSTVGNEGNLQTSIGGILSITSSVNMIDFGLLSGLGSGVISVTRDLLGDTRSADLYNPRGTVRLDGAGTAAAPQFLEAMSRDLGAVSSGFVKNFVCGTLALANNTYVRLVDQSDNAAGTEPEAVYVNFLVVPACTTLDLNGLNLYARAMLVDGSVGGGSVTQTLDSGALAFGAPTPGSIAVPDELDEWQFFGRAARAVTVVVNPGSSGSPAPLNPRLNLADVQIIDPAGNVLASGDSVSAGSAVLLTDVSLPSDGTYRIHIRGAQTTNVGNYVVTLWDSTVDEAALSLGQRHLGQIEGPFSRDRWVFSASAGQQVKFDLINSLTPGAVFSLAGPAGFAGFSGLSGDSDLVNLTHTGTYTLTASSNSGQTGAYSFQLLETTQVQLILGTPYAGTFAGSGQAQLFRVNVPEGKPLRVNLDDDSSINRNELYVQYGAPPTRAEYQYRFTAPGADQQVLVPRAAAGDWYILVYSAVSQASSFTLTAQTSDIVLNTVTPDHHGDGADAVLTVFGAGFERTTTIELVAAGGAAFPAAAVHVDPPTQLTATFAAGSVPPGVYTIRARQAGVGSTYDLPNAFRMESGGVAHLETRLILPNAVGRLATSTIYVEYANTGSVAMPAPLLVLRATDRTIFAPIVGVSGGGSVSVMPIVTEHVLDTVQLLGSGSVPGLLQPGERLRAPVLFAGLAQPWDFSDTSVEFSLGVVQETDATEFAWDEMKNALRPKFISAGAWDVIYANLEAQVGATWGDYVRMLNENARYLGRFGENVTDAGQLGSFEVQQASGLSPLASLGAETDLVVPAPGMPITFRRSFSATVVGRYDQSLLGYGWAWDDGWQGTLFVEDKGDGDADLRDGAVTVSGATCGCAASQPRGIQRRFVPDPRRPNVYVSETGDHATLTRLLNGRFQLREANGLLTRFRADDRVDSVEDTNGNRITATWAGDQLTRLMHSSGQFLAMSYNAGGRLQGLVDSLGRTVSFTYDESNEHLLSVTGIDGQTTQYGYSTTPDAARRHALVSIAYHDGSHQFFTYDTRGRLESFARDGNVARFHIGYNSTGQVTITDATGIATRTFRDHRGAMLAYEDALGNRTFLGFDGDRNLSHVTDALGQEYSFFYDTRGNLTRSTDPLGHNTTFTYTTNFNRLASMTDARGNALNYGYDFRGNVTSITYANGSVERFTVDSRGDPDTYTNRRGQVVDSTYDASGRLRRQDFPDGSFVEYRYNVRGNLDQAIAPEGTTLFEYLDPSNPELPTKITYPNGRSLSYTYDRGRRASLIHPDGYAVNYLYDAAGRLEFLRDGDGNLIVRYQYDTASRVVRRTNGNGTFTTYEYDTIGRTEYLVNRAPDGSVNSRFDYEYDALGRRTRMTTLDGVWDYTYDAIGQLTHAVFTSNDTSVVPDQDLEYVYDAVGNRVRTIINGVTTEYTTNNLNQYTQVGPTGCSFDLDGNLIARVNGAESETFAYDTINRLVGVQAPGGTWVYEYDALGNRSATVRNGERTEYLIDPFGLGNVVTEYGRTGKVNEYVHAFGNLINRISVDTVNYYDFDALGSTVGLTGSAGGYVNRYSYRPFGERLIATETVSNPFAYVGNFGVMEEGNGLGFMRSRYYSPLVGRFISEDPVGLDGGHVNTVTYVSNSPVNMVDPLGLRPKPWPFLPRGPVRKPWYKPNPTKPGPDIPWPELPDMDVPDWAPQEGLEKETGQGWIQALDKTPDCGYPGFMGQNAGRYAEYLPGGRGGRFCGPRPSSPDMDPPDPPGDPDESHDVPILRARDPNQKIGSAGFGQAGFITPVPVLSFRIDFENEERATAPAQRVIITDQLDTDLDWSTFQFTEFGFGDHQFALAAGQQFFQTTLPLTIESRSLEVDVTLSFDSASGLITAVFQTWDPATNLPPDVLTGFLAPEDGTGRGQGFLSYIVDQKPGLPTGTEIRNVALITFDGEGAIATNQIDPHDPSLGTDPAKEALNTIDAGTPTSSVSPLPAEAPGPTFTVTWSGQDDPGGSGIASYDIYVSVDGGPFAPWLQATSLREAEFSGSFGRTYAFYSVATDNVGYVEASPTTADATTTILVTITVNAGPDQSASEGAVVALPAAAYTSLDDHSHLHMTIAWGDGKSEPGKLAPGTGDGTIANTHRYADNGTYTITVSLSDTTGATVQDQALVTILNVVPTVSVGSSTATTIGQAFSRAGSFADPGADTWTATVDYGDGSGAHPLPLNADKSFALSHTFASPGSFAVSVWINDKDGAVDSGSFTVYVLPAPVAVLSVKFGTIKVGKGKRARKTTALVIQLSGPLNPAQAQSLAPYHLLSGTTRRGRTTYRKNVPLATAQYAALTNTVALIPRGRLKTARPMQLRITAASLTDAYGRPIDGNHDGQPGGDAVINLSKNRMTIRAASQRQAPVVSPRTVAAVDSVLGTMNLTASPLPRESTRKQGKDRQFKCASRTVVWTAAQSEYRSGWPVG